MAAGSSEPNSTTGARVGDDGGVTATTGAVRSCARRSRPSASASVRSAASSGRSAATCRRRSAARRTATRRPSRAPGRRRRDPRRGAAAGRSRWRSGRPRRAGRRSSPVSGAASSGVPVPSSGRIESCEAPSGPNAASEKACRSPPPAPTVNSWPRPPSLPVMGDRPSVAHVAGAAVAAGANASRPSASVSSTAGTPPRIRFRAIRCFTQSSGLCIGRRRRVPEGPKG